jgi:hypothetical protein
MNEPTPEQTSTLRETCVLVDYHGGFANWKKRDARASHEYSQQATNDPNSYIAHKNIFVGCDAILASIKGVINEARNFHYTITLPAPKSWGTAALLSNALVPIYKETMTKFEMKLDGLKLHLSNEWGTMKHTAKQALGAAYNDDDYGDLQGVLDGCYISVDYRGVPSASDVKDHPTLGFIRDAMKLEASEAYDSAILNLWGRLLESVRAANENLSKLTKDQGRFRTEWHANLTELLPLLRGLNISKDQRFEEMANEAEKLLRFDPNALKESVGKRARLAEEADRLHRKLAAIYKSKGGQQ